MNEDPSAIIQESIDSLKKQIQLLRPCRFSNHASNQSQKQLNQIRKYILALRRICHHKPKEYLVVNQGKKSTKHYCSICGAKCSKTFANKD